MQLQDKYKYKDRICLAKLSYPVYLCIIISMCDLLLDLPLLKMERLMGMQQQHILKMYNKHLHVKLISTGYVESVMEMDRENLLATYADMLASGKLSWL